MSETTATTAKYWFGQRAGRVFLFDSSFQPESPEDLFLWELGPQEIRFFKKALIRQALTKITPDFDTNSVIVAYEAWRESDGQKYRDEHMQRLSRVEEVQSASTAALILHRKEIADRAAQAHRNWLRKLPEYKGVEMPSEATSRYRTSVCWSCKCSVSADQNPICRKCGWLVCVCGACECNISYVP